MNSYQLREINRSDLSRSEKRERIQKLFDEHARYVERKMAQFAELRRRLEKAAPDFVDAVIESDVETPDE